MSTKVPSEAREARSTKMPMVARGESDAKHKKEWMEKARKSDSAKNLEELMKGRDTSVDVIKEEMFEKVYEALGSEIEGDDLVRVLVVRNEKAGFKTSLLLSIATLGLWYCLRPRDDDTVLVLTKQGRVVQLRVERPPCLPGAPVEVLLVVFRYVAVLFGILVLPIVVQSILTGRTVKEELHHLHLDYDGLHDLPDYLMKNKFAVIGVVIILFFWICSLMPHDFRDRHRRRHMTREVAASQFMLYGCTCRRRSSMKLYFGKYPPQLVMNLAGNLGNAAVCSTVEPGELLNSGRPSAPRIIMYMTLFISCITGLDTFFTWMERAHAVQHSAAQQMFCHETKSESACVAKKCHLYGADHHLNVSTEFCSHVYWEKKSRTECALFGTKAPCCAGCDKGAAEDLLSEGHLAAFKTLVSLVADIGTVLFALLAAKFALGLMFATDHVEVLIKRRSNTTRQMEIAKFDNTVPVCADFVQHVFHDARNTPAKANSKRKQVDESKSFGSKDDEGSKWCGVSNYTMDDATRDWEDFFEKELLAPPDCRWTANVEVPRHLLGLADDEQVLAAWAEMPLHPFNMTLADLLMGGLLYTLLPFGKTRHSVIVTDRRLFYVRYRRPAIPLKVLGVDLRIDCFRHDHDVFYGQMARTKVNFVHRMVHQTCLREQWLPGTVSFQNKFGALQIHRYHGDVQDVYQLVCSLSKNTTTFLDKQMLRGGSFDWDRSVADLQSSMTQVTPTVWSIKSQLDDAVEPKPDIHLGSKEEEIVFHMTFKDLQQYTSGKYTNTDLVVTTGRVFLWHRACYKRFDCQALLYWATCWLGCLNPVFSAKNLQNECSFFTLKALLSFSTDLSVDPPSWLEPHHQPLKVPCFERLCWCLTHLFDGRRSEGKGLTCGGCCPRRTAPTANLSMMWRLRQSAAATEDFVVCHRVKPYSVEEGGVSDNDDVYLGLGLSAEDIEEQKKHALMDDNEGETQDKIDLLRVLMSIVQDKCHKILEEVDEAY